MARLTSSQEDGCGVSIFAFDVLANKSRLPLARNALKKLRTMRHPGVIKVLDAVEVCLAVAWTSACHAMLTGYGAGRDAYIHRDGTTRAFALACQEEKPEPGDDQVGTLQHCGWFEHRTPMPERTSLT